MRASRRLDGAPAVTGAGPIRYEVVEPLRSVRFVLEANDAQPIAFDWLFESIVPAALEDRTHMRQGYRVGSDLVRYHQIGLASGWVEVEGTRHEISPDTWVSTRDHSWGVRYDVGLPPRDLEPRDPLAGLSFRMIWSPIAMQRPDGTRYGLFLHYQIVQGPGFTYKQVVMGGVEHPDGTVERFVDLEPALTFDPANRRLRGGTIEARTATGEARTLELEAVSETGFHLGAGLYFGLDGHHHGEWRGDLHVEGEHDRRLRGPRDRPTTAPDPRHRGARRRPRGGRGGMGQLPAHHHRRRRRRSACRPTTASCRARPAQQPHHPGTMAGNREAHHGGHGEDPQRDVAESGDIGKPADRGGASG